MPQNVLKIFAFISILVIICATYLCEGDNGTSIAQLFGLEKLSNSAQEVILNQIRIPRLLCAASVGALLSLSGNIMQNLFRNPIVEPYTLGISGGSVLGVAIAFASGCVYSFGASIVPTAATIGGLCSMTLVLSLRRAFGNDIQTTLLCGIIISFVASSATTLVLSISSQENVTQIIAWTIGSFETANATYAHWVAALALCLTCASVFIGNILNVIQLGDTEANALGLNTKRTTLMLIILATLATAISVSIAGIVSFVGMIAPHIVRRTMPSDNRIIMPACGIVGACLTVSCDLVAKTIIWPRELPAGAITALLGGALFLWVMGANKAHYAK